MSVYRRLLGLLWPYRRRVALAVLLGVATIVANTGLLATAAYLLSEAALVRLLFGLTGAVYLVRLFGLSRAFLRYGERLISHGVTFRLLARVRTWTYQQIEPLAPGGLVGKRSGDLLARIVKDVDELEHLFQHVIGPVAVAFLTVGCAVGALLIFGTAPALVALAFLLVAGIGLPLLSGLLERGRGGRRLAARSELDAQLVDGVQGMADLLALGRGADLALSAGELGDRLGSEQRRASVVTGLHLGLSELVANLALVAVVLAAIPLVGSSRMGGVYLAALGLLVMGSFEAVQPLGRAFQFLGRTGAAGERLFELANVRPAVADPTEPVPVPAMPLLEFDHVGFAYAPGEPRALDGVTFALEPGSRLAIVGPSGAGKSTIVALAARFWDPTEGEVRLGGRDLRHCAQEDVRSHLAVVTQDAHLFNNTVRANLMVGRPGATEAELATALERARLAELIESLPQGLDTWVGEHGQRLSGGERQRLAIARALLRDAPLLIVDEVTANLDPIVEGEVLVAIRELMDGRTTLLITHRLVQLDDVDEVLVLDHGRVVERGTAAGLAMANGLYRRLLDAQNQYLTLA
ncbi:MAG TPA: thiol reductant ABC exporter subunit CydC [Thermomicrobiaceae bacterium]|nr:thiol reductant ABC exporter subunit CydC [Thermomicrobiaceae bacterium]